MKLIKNLYVVVLFFGVVTNFWAQKGSIQGTVLIDNEPAPYVSVLIKSLKLGSTTDDKGKFIIENVPFGSHDVTASYLGFNDVTKKITINAQNAKIVVEFVLEESNFNLNEIVITGTKTAKRQTDSPVIVNVVNSKTLANVQACNLADGLKFQPGLRVETNCQTCNYTQLRMNGLAGGYSQILVNGRPIFSPLTGLYGLEQLPVNMIERIEVVRGGGSSLYGSSAIGGTVNVITKVPKSNNYEMSYTHQTIEGRANDNTLTGNTTVVSDNRNAGVSLFINHRERDWYDHNGDNFSELPKLENTSIGANIFFIPTENQKVELSLSNMNEYRYGGEMTDRVAYLTEQSEERTHNVWMGSADYQINFNNDYSSFITYGAWQNTKRKHYTGIFPDEPADIQAHIENPPYGTSNTTTLQGGFQLNHKMDDFIKGTNTFTLGTEYLYDDVLDVIPSYNYTIDQTTRNFGLFLQSDWQFTKSLNLLSGVRMDQHNLVDGLVFNPRLSLLYKHKEFTQFRLNYGTGFRAPQAFDSDLHIAFAGGGVSRISLSPDLEPEKSQSLSGSINFDRPSENFIFGFTIEGFYTRLNDAFFLQPIGEDEFGQLFEKQNGQGATVQGGTLELRMNYAQKLQIEAGFTLQTSEFDDPVQYIDGLEGIREFTRTPNQYGFATLTYNPNTRINFNLNYVYTGSMKVPHFAGAPNQLVDEIITANSFSELSTKLGYKIPLKAMESNLEVYAGVKNIFDAYQDEFDLGKNRDSNFVYGPSLPRSFFVGIKWSSI
uniref:TonB-dependent receptor n=1 Tax=Flavobacterium sp. TaxID=239 RepID=UPI004049794E